MSSTMTGQIQKEKTKKQQPGFESIFKNDIAAAIDYICKNYDSDFGLSELSEKTGISSRNVYRVIDVLLAKRIVRKTREIGSARMFQYNDGNNQASILKSAYDLLIKRPV
jgi:AraC-like DNA-binding protein